MIAQLRIDKSNLLREDVMVPGFLLWLLGVPLTIVILLWLFGVFS